MKGHFLKTTRNRQLLSDKEGSRLYSTVQGLRGINDKVGKKVIQSVNGKEPWRSSSPTPIKHINPIFSVIQSLYGLCLNTVTGNSLPHIDCGCYATALRLKSFPEVSVQLPPTGVSTGFGGTRIRQVVSPHGSHFISQLHFIIVPRDTTRTK